MHGHRTAASLTLALLTATFLTPPDLVQAAPGDALGGEFQVNAFTTDNQWDPAVAMAPDGDFIVAWSDYGGQDGSYGGVFAQRYDAAGVARGPAFQVNSFTTGDQVGPSIAMAPDGDFVVTWSDRNGQDGDQGGIFARRFDAVGVPQGPEFQVNTYFTGDQFRSAVAMDADGDFVVTWHSNGQDGHGFGVFAQRYNAAGVRLGTEFQVNNTTLGHQARPAVAMDAGGDFVVVWDTREVDGIYQDISAKRYNAAGVAQGAEFQVNSYTTGNQAFSSVSMDVDGDFVVTWESYSQDGGGDGIFAQRYDKVGTPLGPEFQVNSFAPDDQRRPVAAMDADGDFVVAWYSYGQDGSGYGVFAQRFNSAGVTQGAEVQVNTSTANNQGYPSVAMDADGDFVVAWESGYIQYGSYFYDVFAQRYDGAERIEGDFDGDGNADVLWRNTATGNAFVWLMEGTERRAAGSIGTVPLAWQVDGTGDFNGDGKADILWRHSETGSAVIWQMDGFTKADSAGIGRPPLDWVVEQLRDTDGDGSSDIFWRNTTTGGTLVWRMSGFTRTIVGSPGAAGPPWEVQ